MIAKTHMTDDVIVKISISSYNIRPCFCIPAPTCKTSSSHLASRERPRSRLTSKTLLFLESLASGWSF